MRLYLNEYPRTFVVTESSYALIIRHPSPTYTATESSNRHDRSKHNDTRKQRSAPELENKVIVEFLNTDMLNLSAFIDITPSKTRHNKELQGFLGFLNLKGHIHLGFITRSRTVSTPQRGENIHQIEEVDFYCLDSDQFDIFINRNEPELDSGLDDPNFSDNNDRISNTYPAGSVKRLLSHGNFYFLKDFDVTSSLQERGIASQLKYGDVHHAYSQRFAWNHFMSERLAEFRVALNTAEKRRFDELGFLTVIIRGYTRTVEIALVGDENLTMTLISKQSCKRNGALFGEGGSDEDGEVPNFVETEIVVSSDKFSFSYVIVRGNVPGFWKVNTNFSKKSIVSTKLNKTIKFPRSYEAAHHAVGRHFDTLGRHFGGVHVISCLQNDEKSYKGQLSADFTSHLNKFIEDREVAELDAKALNDATSNKAVNSNYKVTYTHMSLTHSFVKRVGYSSANPGEIVAPISEKIVEFGAMFYDFKRKTYIGKQLGVFRVNSFDSSTKANFVSKIISQEVITLAFRDIGFTPSSDLYKHHALLWEHNEESLKKLAIVPHLSELKSSKSKNFIKQHLAHKYLNGVRDSRSMEGAIQKLLGRLPNQVVVKLYNPFHQHIRAELQKRSSEFKFQKDICIYAATFNVNGTLGSEDDIRRLLFPRKHAPQASYDLVFLGLQEIIELTPGKMINVKSDKFLEWEMMIKNLLEEHGKKEKYVSFWGCQMGGVAMLVFVNENQLEYISDTEGLLKKTGLGGISASKGAIAVSFNYSATSFCFICAHLAAGQGNVDDRHQNYKAIAKILFSKKKKIREHDAVIWLGDFNFRIDLPTDRVKALVEQKNYQLLLEHDQLGKQMAMGETFPFFDEKEISFPPTYKFDNNTKTYDTSEKQRTPAWTDRILNLSRSNILKQGVYDSEEDIIFSDHRPVYSIFTASVSVVNEKAKKEVTQCIYESYTKAMGDINDLLAAPDVSRFVYDKDNDSKPAPSSDTFKWWLEKGQLAKVSIPELDSSNHADLNRLVFNPQRPANPFWESSEPEFIKRSELMQMLQAIGALRE